MNRFDETVSKLAHSRVKVAILAQLLSAHSARQNVEEKRVRELTAKTGIKKASVFEHVFGGDKPSGAQAVARMIAGGVGAAAVTGGGAYAIGKHLDKSDASNTALEAQRKQMGILKGEQLYRHSLSVKLAPMHTKVFNTIKKDPVISKADHTLIHSSYNTMKRFAPHLAADENAARSFLRESAIYGTGPSYASLKTLADSEMSVGKASGLGG